MGKNNKKQMNQRQIIEKKISRFSRLSEPPPPSGWVKAIRGSLGMSIRQLADRMGVNHGSINQLEKREPNKKITLELLERAAQAMDCRLVYAIIPNESAVTLENIIEGRARKTAEQISNQVDHSMKLESQGTSRKDRQREVKRITRKLKESGDPIIWSADKIKKKAIK